MRFYSRCISPHLSPRIYSSVLPRRPTPSLRTLPVCSSPPLQKFSTSRPCFSKQGNESTPSNQSAASGKTPSTNGAASSSGGDAAAAATAAGPTKGKPARTMTAKNSLRRVAIIAQQPKRIKKSAAPPPSASTADTAADASAAKEPPTVASAVCMAEAFSMPTVLDILTSHGFQIDPDSTGFDLHEVVHARGVSGDGDIFVFPSGTLVAWSLAPDVVSRQLLRAAVEVHPPHLREAEDLDFVVDPDRETSFLRAGDDVLVLGTRRENRDADRRDTTLAKIAFSSGLARSTKLAVLETALTSYFESTRHVPPMLSRGAGVPLSRRFILQKTGELLSLRARLNHYSELTDALPDIFWDSRSELGLEGYYEQVGRALDVNVRIRALNQKMDYAQEIASVLRELSSEQHNTRLEWIIILLIAVEVVFELRRDWLWYQKREVD